MGLLELPAQCLQLAHIAWLVLCWTAEKEQSACITEPA